MSSIVRYYSKLLRGRKPFPRSSMLRIHSKQLFYNLIHPAMEDTSYEVESMSCFSGISIDTVPDETTILNFGHLLERRNLGKKQFTKINKHLVKKGLSLEECAIVDATITSAPTRQKSESRTRDHEMHQTKKGSESHFGMKMRIGVDDTFGVIHSLGTTFSNIHDINRVRQLLHGNEKRMWADEG